MSDEPRYDRFGVDRCPTCKGVRAFKVAYQECTCAPPAPATVSTNGEPNPNAKRTACARCGHARLFHSAPDCPPLTPTDGSCNFTPCACQVYEPPPESPPGDATTLDATRLIELLTIESGFWTRDVASQFAALATALPGLIDAEKQLHRTTTALLAARDDRDEARGQVADLLVLNAGLNLELARLRARNEELEAKLTSARSRIADIENEPPGVEEHLLGEQLRAAESRLTQVRQDIEALPQVILVDNPHGEDFGRAISRQAVLSTFDQPTPTDGRETT